MKIRHKAMIYASIVLLVILLWFWNSLNYQQEKKKLHALVKSEVNEEIRKYRWKSIENIEEMSDADRTDLLTDSKVSNDSIQAEGKLDTGTNKLKIKIGDLEVTNFLKQIDDAILDSLVTKSLNGISPAFSFDYVEKELLSPTDIGFEYADMTGQNGTTHFVLKSYSGYLLKKIFWQLLGGFLVLTLLMLSLYFLYRIYITSQEELKIRDEFISTISHELRTPVATVGAALEAISQHNVIDDKEKTLNYVNLAAGETDRLKRLIDRSLQSQHGWTIKKSSFDIFEMLREVVDKSRLSTQKEIMINLSCKMDECYVMGDKDHLTQVMHNLIDNSIKYSDKTPEISIDLRKTDHELIVQVQDNGVGIPGQYLDRITERMFRVPSGNVHKVKGYGLGLDYVNQIIALHNGKLSFESKVGQGTIVYIKLPHE